MLRLGNAPPDRKTLEPLFTSAADMRAAITQNDVSRWSQADEQFHRDLLRLSGNQTLCAQGFQMRDYVLRAHMVALRLQTDAYRHESTDNHHKLLEAIQNDGGQIAATSHFAQRQRGEDALIDAVEASNITRL